jgi:methyltransferase-like protein
MAMSSEMSNVTDPNAYDEVPYSHQPYPQSHPDRLATLGRLFGLSPSPITHCRVLELGCATGGNLIPMAFHLPNSEFIGVELAPRQAERAQKAVEDLNLNNVRVVNASIMDVDRSWGTFDYIISHGVYSWVPDEVRDMLLTVSSRNLAPQGITYVSYNTYPGWHLRGMVRDMMLFHANQFADPQQSIAQARALVDFLGRSVAKDRFHGLLIQEELNHLRECSDSYVYHDYLEKVNAPVYFHQFAAMAGKHGLQYLAEAEFNTMFAGGFSKETAETLEQISQDLIHTEQYMDFVRNRFFRQTLLCHGELTPKRDLGPECLTGLLVASAARPEPEPVKLLPGEQQSFRTPKGVSILTDHSLTKAGLLVLSRKWPRAMDLDALCREALSLLPSSSSLTENEFQRHRRVFLEYLLKCYAAGSLEVRSWQADFLTEVSERPKVSALAQYLVAHGLPVVNQRHHVVHLDPPTQRLCLFLDGTRDRTELLLHFTELVAEGALTVRLDGDPLTNPHQIRDVMADGLERALANLARAALLVA